MISIIIKCAFKKINYIFKIKIFIIKYFKFQNDIKK